MLNPQQHLGRTGECLAAGFLKKRGYRILERNYRTPLGEIDIIAQERQTLVFVEVKTRRSCYFGDPKAAVTFAKQKKISRVALCYLKTTGQMNTRARFDVVSITTEPEPHFELIKNAFDLAYG